MTRWLWVDYAKGIGILLVVYGHVLRGLQAASLTVDPHFFRISDTVVYGFHMPLFFLLSGLFCLKWLGRGTATDQIRSKVRTILVPYLLWSLIQGTLNIWLSAFTNGDQSFSRLLTSILYRPYGQFWFLYVLFIYFILVIPLYTWTGRRGVVAAAVLGHLFHPLAADYWPLQPILANFIYFALGIALAEMPVSSLLPRLRPAILLPLVGVFLAVNYGYFVLHMDQTPYGLLVALSGLMLVAAVSVLLGQRGQWPFLARLGELSMPIYLMHILAMSGTRIILLHMFGIKQVQLHVLAGTLAGVALPVVAYKAAQRLRLDTVFFAR